METIKQKITPMAVDVEKLFHGFTTTGNDVKTIINGGFCAVDHLGVSPIPFSEDFSLLMVFTQNPKLSTAELVQKVKECERRDELISEIGELTHKLRDLVGFHSFASYPEFKTSVHRNHKLLAELGLSIPNLDEIVGF